MKKILLLVIGFTVYYCTLAGEMHNIGLHQKENTKQVQPVMYTCPMHPEIHEAKPGNCPKCGMPLVKEKPKATAKPVVKKPGEKPIPTNKEKPKVVPAPSKKAEDTNMEMTKDTAREKKAGMGNMKIPEADPTKLTPKIIVNNTPPRTVRYDLYIKDTLVNFTGKTKRAIAVNGQIPMPTLTFTERDTAEIYVHNQLNESTSLHWHGLMLPNQFDGVPNLTQMPIKPYTTHVYRFPIIQSGTHWYHSHSGLQEQIGMYGAMILNKRDEPDMATLPVVLSEWTDMNPNEVDRSLHNATDWFAIKKGSTQSYAEALRGGHFKTKLTNEWKRMNAMDVSDVYYERFLINGKEQNEQPQYKAGDKVRLRISNGGASTYFWLTYAGGKITVVANDGNDVVPVEVDRLIIAVSETFDVIVTVPENMSYEFLVTAEDRTRSASLWLGSGMKMPAQQLPRLKYFAGMKMMNDMMDMNGNLMPMGMKMSNQTMDMNSVMYPEVTGASPNPSKGGEKIPHHMAEMNMEQENVDMVTLNYAMLKSPFKTTLPEPPLGGQEGWKILKFDLTGNMNRYVWTLDNKTISESDRILIKKGENVRIILYNNSMMRHPMHLHGHDFRVLNGQGEYAPLKNVLDVMPMERDTIEFAANTSGDWFFHCHILYHMMSGMGRIFSYENSPPNPEIPDPNLAKRKLNADDRMMHFMVNIGLQSNGSDGEAMFAQTRWKLSTMWHLGYHDMHGFESETMIGRYLGRNQWIYPYIGFDYHYKKEGGPKNIFGSEEKNWFGQTSNRNSRKTIVAGIAYTLPLLFIADARVDGKGKFRFQLSREDIPLGKRLRFNIMLNTDKEYTAGLRYIITKYFALSTHYDSDMGLGAGITITY